MAQIVRYFHDFENETERKKTYAEGPFVVCSFGGRYRIECEMTEHKCPVLCDVTISKLREKLGYFLGMTNSLDSVIQQVDELNELVKKGEIVCNKNGMWIHKPKFNCLTCGDTKWMPGGEPCSKCNKGESC